MFTWTYSETVPTLASASQIWSRWQDAEQWPTWDCELDWVRLEGPFEAGTTGKMKPSAGPEVAFELSEVSPERSFSDIARLPLTKMVFLHEYLPLEKGGAAQIRHTVTMTGLLAPLFGKIIGSQIKAHLRSAMEALSIQAASEQTSTASMVK